MNKIYEPVKIALIAAGLCAGQGARAEKLFSLSCDNLERTPVGAALYLDAGKTEAEKVQKTDSIRLVKGVKGLGVYLDDSHEFIALPESASVSPEHGAISFWARPIKPAGGKNRNVISVEFEKGRFAMLDEAAFAVLDGTGQWNYGPHNDKVERWLPGQWHHIVLNWSSETGKRQVFVDNEAGPLSDYFPPVGKGRVYLSPMPTSAGGVFPACGVLDEIAFFDEPLTEEEVAVLHDEGRKALGEAAENTDLDISLYPNLAKDAVVTLSPEPNYQNHDWTCNGPDDQAQLADNHWQLAWYGVKKSVGWQDTPEVTLDYDLGALKQIGAVGINIGAGDSGVVFPSKVTFYVGATEEKLVKVGEVAAAEPEPNTAYPKWHDQLIGVANVNRPARFVQIRVECASLFVDEVFIVEKGAQPVFATAKDGE